MRATLAAVLLSTLPLHADEIVAHAPAATAFSVTYSLNVALNSTDPEAIATQDRADRRALYARAVDECEDVLATIASACSITGISLSTQVNAYPGQPPTLYVSASVSMQVSFREPGTPPNSPQAEGRRAPAALWPPMGL